MSGDGWADFDKLQRAKAEESPPGPRCRYADCPEGNPDAGEDERVTCPKCREDLGLPPL